MEELILSALEVLKIPIFFYRTVHKHLLGKRCVPCLHLLLCWCVAARETEHIAVVLHKQRAEMGDAVALAKKSPYAVFVIWVAAIKLYGFQFGKLLNQRLVNDQPLIAVPSRRLVFVLTDALLQKFVILK